MIMYENSYKTETLIDEDKESYIQVTQITTKSFKDGSSKVVSEYKYPKVYISTKFNDLLEEDIFYHKKDEDVMKDLIQRCVTLQLEKAVATDRIIVDKEFTINEKTYFIIYIPTRHWIYSNHVMGIIKEISKSTKIDRCITILPSRELYTNNMEIPKDIWFESFPINYFYPEKFTNYIWEKISQS